MGKELSAARFEIDQIQKIMSLAQKYEFQNIFPLQRFAKSGYFDYLNFEITRILADPENKAFFVHETSEYSGFATLSVQKWDEKIFGVKIAAVPHLISIGDSPVRDRVLALLMGMIIKECAQENIKLVSARINSGDLLAVHALEKSGFLLMDTIVTKYTETKKWKNTNTDPSYRIRESEAKDIADIKELARLGFQDYVDRFHQDPNLNNRDADNLYAEWAANSCQGYADAVYVAEDNAQLVGFATCKLYKDVEKYSGLRIGEIVLIATAPDSRGKGVFGHLIENCMSWFLGQADFVIYKTQINNLPVQKALQKYGFQTESYKHTFHNWLSSGRLDTVRGEK